MINGDKTMQKILISEVENNPIQIGDYIKIISISDFKKLGVKFDDVKLQKRISSSTLMILTVTGINKENGMFFYECSDLQGHKIPTRVVDSDIKYIIRE